MNATQTKPTNLILMNLNKCTCGCEGNKPEHKIWFRRKVITSDGKTGSVITPWGRVEVIFVNLSKFGTGKFVYWQRKGLGL